MHDLEIPASATRVRSHTPQSVNHRIDLLTAAAVRAASQHGEEAETRRMSDIDQEWDIERWLETNAGAISLSGLILGALVSRKWLALPTLVFPFLMQHALQGWCPPVFAFRRIGVRTRDEIDAEKYALKVLRGDFRSIPEGGDPSARAAAALNASMK